MNQRARCTVLGIALFALAVVSAACGDAQPRASEAQSSADLATAMRSYVGDPAVGRRALERGIVNRGNGYSQLRLAQYDDEHWGRLPEFDPPTAPILLGAGDAPVAPPASGEPSWSSLDANATGWTLDELRALGERAFFRYPLQSTETLPAALASADHAGVWQDEGRFGAVWVTLPRGLVRAALTCATCHASKVEGRLIAGRNNPDLDAAKIYDSSSSGLPGTYRWGLGRVDVTDDGIDNPVAITDLRPIRHQQHLHHAATLVNDPVTLAVRIETLIVTSHAQAVRPPRKIAAALAVYLLGLAPEAPLPAGGEGAGVFARECGSCHRGEATSGAPVSLERVGTDRAVGASSERGTGFYRVPSLRSVGDRRRMFASGDIDDIDALLTPGRAVAGHPFGLALDVRERDALLVYLRGL
jgi:mono/diheme cytochrome c family protein